MTAPDTRWVYVENKGDGAGWSVRRVTMDERVEDWPLVVKTMYEDEARRVCRVHNYDDTTEERKP